MNNKLLIISANADQYKKLLSQIDVIEVEFFATRDVAQAISISPGFTALFGEPDLLKKVIPHAKDVRWVQSSWAGVTPIIKMCEKLDLKLTGVKDIFGPLMSEYVFCYILLFERFVIQKIDNQASKRWDETLPGRLQNRTLGVIGLGSIGRHVASTAKHFGMQVWGLDIEEAPCEHVDTLFLLDRKDDFLAGPDYFVTALPDIPATTNLLDADAFKKMKTSAVIINIGRGNALDDDALVNALKNGHIGGAVLDVFSDEPLPTDHPFWEAPNLHITSHTAAPTFPEDVLPILVDNCRRFDTGQELKYLVDYNKGY